VSRLPHRAAVLSALAVAVSLLAMSFGTSDGAAVQTARSTSPASDATTAARPAAERFPVDGALMQSARRLAAEHWNAVPCGGQVTITWKAIEDDANASVTWMNPTDVWGNPGANYDCSIALNPIADFDFAKVCTVLTHEIGHLVGQQHAGRPGKLMSPTYTTPSPACKRAEPVPAVERPAQQRTARQSVSRANGARCARGTRAGGSARAKRATRRACVVGTGRRREAAAKRG